jgi:ELWxxDGT repeat protein
MPAKRSLTLALALLLVAAIPVRASSFPAVTIVDLEPGATGSRAMDVSDTADLNGYQYFVASVGADGYELWRTNGLVSTLVKDIAPGSGSSFPSQFTRVGDTLYFIASDGVHGHEIWRTDGTTAGTTIVKDIRSGVGGSGPEQLHALGNDLYFSADDGVAGYELWRSDGTSAGTTLVKDIVPGSSASDPNWLTVIGDHLYFSAFDANSDEELWRSDGTGAGTARVKDIRVGADSSSPQNLASALYGGYLYFGADDGINGIELWRTDGTAAGTTLVENINPSSSSSNPQLFTELGGYLYFSANDGTNGTEVWRTNGTLTEMVANSNPTDSSDPDGFVVFDDMLFMGLTSNTYGHEFCALVYEAADAAITCWDLSMGSNSTFPQNFTVIGDYLYFIGSGTTTPRNIWRVARDLTRTTITMPVGSQLDCISCNSQISSAGNRLYMTISGAATGDEFAYIIEPTGSMPSTNSEGSPWSTTLVVLASLTAAAGLTLRMRAAKQQQ